MKVTIKNISKDITLKEKFFGFGVVTLKPGEVKSVPKDIADAWLNPVRQKLVVEIVKDEVVKQEKEQKKEVKRPRTAKKE